MKTITTLALTAALTGAAFSVQAASQAERDVATCKAELRGIYGGETELNLVDRRRNQHGTRMRVAAKLDEDNSYFATCWVARYDEGDIDYQQKSTAVASVELDPVSR